MDASHVYMRACALGCCQSYQYPNLLEGADRISGPLHGDKECPFSGVTKYGRIWRKVPESDAQSVHRTLNIDPVFLANALDSTVGMMIWRKSDLLILQLLKRFET